MRKFIILLLITLNWGCETNQDITLFDDDQNYIYFGLPNPNNRFAGEPPFIDSLDFSFVFEEHDAPSKVLKIPVHIAGQASKNDRRYAYSIDTEQTTVDLSLVKISDPIIRSGRLVDTLYIELERNEILREGKFLLALKMEDNLDFKTGHVFNTKLKIWATDYLSEPVWWLRWRSVFGNYTREVYELWMEIYPLGVDPNPTFIKEKPYYYWDNMPNRAQRSWYPNTFLFVDKLRKYLEDNPVYPDGDSTKDRIYLPKGN